MYFCFNPFSVRSRFYDSMRTHVCICTCPQCLVCPRDKIARAYAFMHVDLCAHAIHIMQIVFSMITEVKVLQQQKRVYVHFMCMLPC